jgi:hypothetical protein
MQVCGTRHPDHYKRSLEERDGPANATEADEIGDLNACLSVYSKLAAWGATNISLAHWQLYALSDITYMKRFDLSLNVTDQMDGWVAKFTKWDSNSDGFLTWEEAMVVQPWSWP